MGANQHQAPRARGGLGGSGPRFWWSWVVLASLASEELASLSQMNRLGIRKLKFLCAALAMLPCPPAAAPVQPLDVTETRARGGVTLLMAC